MLSIFMSYKLHFFYSGGYIFCLASLLNAVSLFFPSLLCFVWALEISLMSNIFCVSQILNDRLCDLMLDARMQIASYTTLGIMEDACETWRQ